MTRDDYEALALRVEREEPSRELDLAVALAVGWTYHAPPMVAYLSDPKRPRMLKKAPRYTTCLDAAASLVPDGWVLDQIVTENQFTRVYLARVLDAADAMSLALTEPRARTAAAIRAQAMEIADDPR